MINHGNLSRFFLGNKNLRNIAGKFVPESKKHSLINSLLLKWDAKKPPMQEEDKVFLHSIFANDIKKLESLLNIKFPWFKDIKLNNEI